MMFRGISHALLAEPGAAVAVLNRNGAVTAANAAFTALGGLAALPEAAREAVHAALRSGVAQRLALGPDAPVDAVVLPFGPRRGGMLRLTDLRAQRDMQCQFAEGQRLQALGQLAAGIAHDFNNILAGISGAAEALAAVTPQAGRDDLAVIRDGAARGAGLVRHLLAFTGQQTLRPQRVALNDAVRDVASLLRRLLDAPVTLELALEEPGRFIRIDPGQLDQVLINLAVNARDAMPQGGTLRIATGHRVVITPVAEGRETLAPGRYVVIEVRDTGIGMPPGIMARIFEPFFTTRRGRGGTGLGLATVLGIIRQSGGTLHVESTPGAGTVFRITLPRDETPDPGAGAAQAPLACAGNRALVVDDERAVRLVAARVLRGAGWEVTEADCAEDAQDAAPEGLSLLVSDVSMPGQDGPALAVALRKIFPALRVVLMSGYADAAQRAALQAENIGYVAKPFSAEALLAAAGRPLVAESPAHAQSVTS